VEALAGPGAAMACTALGSFGSQAVPSLIQALARPNADTRLFACLVLKKMKSDAKSAIPKLRSLLNDSNEALAALATEALQEIDPSSLSTEGGSQSADLHMHRIRFYCDHCKKPLLVSSQNAGKKLKCPKCGQITQAPNSSTRGAATRSSAPSYNDGGNLGTRQDTAKKAEHPSLPSSKSPPQEQNARVNETGRATGFLSRLFGSHESTSQSLPATPARFYFRCPLCPHRLSVPTDCGKERIGCPACKQVFQFDLMEFAKREILDPIDRHNEKHPNPSERLGLPCALSREDIESIHPRWIAEGKSFLVWYAGYLATSFRIKNNKYGYTGPKLENVDFNDSAVLVAVDILALLTALGKGEISTDPVSKLAVAYFCKKHLITTAFRAIDAEHDYNLNEDSIIEDLQSMDRKCTYPVYLDFIFAKLIAMHLILKMKQLMLKILTECKQSGEIPTQQKSRRLAWRFTDTRCMQSERAKSHLIHSRNCPQVCLVWRTAFSRTQFPSPIKMISLQRVYRQRLAPAKSAMIVKVSSLRFGPEKSLLRRRLSKAQQRE
jgi:phage FluMu protein Com